MIKTIWNFLVNNGATITLIGRLIILVCLVVLIVNVFNRGSTRTIPLGVIIGGIVIYVIGWVGNYTKKNRKIHKDDSDEL